MFKKLLLDPVRGISPWWILWFVVLLLLWNTPVIYPLKLFVVFLHEVSHGLAAYATGSRLVEFAVNFDQSGHADSIGDSFFSRLVILNAGYLGSLIMGGVILVLASRTEADKTIGVVLGVIVFALTAFYVREWHSIALCVLFGAVLFSVGRWLPMRYSDLLLRAIGFTACMYAPLDITTDVFLNSELTSDARLLAELTHIPTLVWGAIWLPIAVLGTLRFLSWASPRKETEPAIG